MTDLSALIAKLEQAQEGSRELDADIYESLGHKVIRAPQTVGGYAWRYRDNKYGYWSWYSMDRLSTLLDAALTLVPEGWSPSLLSWGDTSIKWEPPAAIRFSIVKNDYSGTIGGWAMTPPLALCIACLKARGLP